MSNIDRAVFDNRAAGRLEDSMLVKLKLQAGPEVEDQARAISAVLLVAGGLVTEELGLCHYTLEAEVAKREWEARGFTVVECEELARGERGLGRLLRILGWLDE